MTSTIHPSLQEPILLRCLSGCAVLMINFRKHPVSAGSFVVVTYDMTLVPLEVSASFSVEAVTLSADICDDAFYRIRKSEFWDYLYDHPVLCPSQEQKDMLEMWFRQTEWAVRRKGYVNELIRNHFSVLMMSLCRELEEEYAVSENVPHDRVWTLTGRFFSLVSRHCTRHRDVRYYADSMSITPDYLYKLTIEAWGMTPKDVIERQVLSSIKTFLSDTDLPVKTIASELNFEDPSYLCRFFRRHTGLSPMEYRDGKQ